MAPQQSDIDRIRDANDIVDVVGEHLALKRAGGGFKGLCPFHHDEKTPSFFVNPDRQTFKCFGCGVGGDVFKFVQLRENVGFVEAVQMLADRRGIQLSQGWGRGSRTGVDRTALLRANEWALRWFQSQLSHAQVGEKARAYIRERRIDAETGDRFLLGYAPGSYDRMGNEASAAGISSGVLKAAGLVRSKDEGRPYAVFRDRLMFAIRDPSGRIIGFGGRALGDDPAKYLNTPETELFNKGRHLFGLDLARDTVVDKGRVVVVEGYTDCLMAHQFGFAETVASLGTSFTRDQARLLHRFTDQVILLFDSDEAGARAADRALEAALAEKLTVRITHVPEGKDPCDYLLSAGAESFDARLKSATDAIEFKWSQVRKQYPASRSASESYRAIDDFLGFLARSADKEGLDTVQLGFIAGKVGKMLSLPADEVFGHVAKLRNRERRRARRSTEAATDAPVRRVADPEQGAHREILEVLLNAPEHFNWVGEHWSLGDISDPRLASIGREFVRVCTAPRGFDLTGFLSEFEEPDMTALITDLQLAGERRGNYEATLQGALNRLSTEREARSPGQASGSVGKTSATRLEEVQRVAERVRQSGQGFVRQRDKKSMARWGEEDGLIPAVTPGDGS